MKLEYRRCVSMPRLSWCTRIERGSDTVPVWIGPWVETRDTFFVEGTWEGPFEAGEFHDSALFMGSGGRLVGEELGLCTPCHTIERLHLLRLEASLVVSNSLACALAAAGQKLDPSYAGYRDDFLAIKGGLAFRFVEVPTLGGPPVELCHFANLFVSQDLDVRWESKAEEGPWTTFDAYRGFLAGCIASLRDNAGCPTRRVSYAMLASLSSGYDSAAGAVLATEAGCRRAVTLRSALSLERGLARVDDSGASIGRALGLEVREFTLTNDHSSRSDTAVEFAACGNGVEQFLAVFIDELPATLFLTGFHGDSLWERNLQPRRDLSRGSAGIGFGLGEFRLAAGFLHLPVPYLGAIQQPSIVSISNSPEMTPWSGGGNYDRPIPRRILAEKGVPSDLYANEKKGAAAQATPPEALVSFVERHGPRRGPMATLKSRVLQFASWMRAAIDATGFGRLWRLAALRRLLARWRREIGEPRHFEIQWGTTVLQERYRIAMSTPEDHDRPGQSVARARPTSRGVRTR